MMWKIQYYLRMAAPWIVISLLAYGGYTLHKKGVFRAGVPSLGKVLSHVPFIGKSFSRFSGHSYAVAPQYPRSSHRHHRIRRHRRR